MRTSLLWLLALGVAIPTWAQPSQQIAEWQSKAGPAVMEVGIYQNGSLQWYSYYQDTVIENQPTTQYFEIGSVTKPLMGMAMHHAFGDQPDLLDQPLADWLPDSLGWPKDPQQPITLRHLVTHTTGLPRLPDNIRSTMKNFIDPFASYEEAALLSFLKEWQPDTVPGARFEYSNTGAGLLLYLMLNQLSTDYDAFTAQHLLSPLGLQEMGFSISDSLMIAPYQSNGYKSVLWHWTETMIGAGGMRATPQSMGQLVQLMASPTAELQSWLAKSTAIQHESDIGPIATFWICPTLGEEPAFWHNGRTYGFETFLGIIPGQEKGLIILTNSTTGLPTSIGLQWLEALATP